MFIWSLFSLSFSPEEQTYPSLTNAVYGVIAGVLVPFPLSQPDVCELGVVCPMETGTDNVETVVIKVLTTYPCVSIMFYFNLLLIFISAVAFLPQLQLIVEWKLKDPSGNEVACFEVPLQITC